MYLKLQKWHWTRIEPGAPEPVARPFVTSALPPQATLRHPQTDQPSQDQWLSNVQPVRRSSALCALLTGTQDLHVR